MQYKQISDHLAAVIVALGKFCPEVWRRCGRALKKSPGLCHESDKIGFEFLVMLQYFFFAVAEQGRATQTRSQALEDFFDVIEVA